VNVAPETAAATRIVITMLRVLGRLELDFIAYRLTHLTADRGIERPITLLVAVNTRFARDNAERREALERWVRALVQRQYFCQGIVDAEYDLQLL
jgi:hypothetical protein